MAAATVVFLVRPVLAIPTIAPRDFNEGYYAYLALRLFSGEGLYPDRTGLIANGYTPIFFYLSGAVGLLTGDNIVAGRSLAFLGYVLSCIGISSVVNRISSSRPLAAFTGLFTAAFFALNHPGYVGMNDPQWVAQAFVVAGLFAFIRWGDTNSGMFATVLLLLCAGMTKQSVVALPVAISGCLLVHRRRDALVWFAYGAIAACVCLTAMYLMHGRIFFTSLLAAGTNPNPNYSVQKILQNITELWKPFAVPLLGLVAFAVLAPRGPTKTLLLLYAVVAASVGLFFMGAPGVGWNHLYDFVIASVISTSLAIGRVATLVATRFPRNAVLAAGSLLAASPLLAGLPAKLPEAYAAPRSLDMRQKNVAQDIAYLSQARDPVLCETMALCYWAKRRFAVDILVLRRKLRTGAITEAEFRQLIDSGYFGVIQFHSGGTSGRTKRLPSEANDYILLRYESRPNAMGGSFLSPRSGEPVESAD